MYRTTKKIQAKLHSEARKVLNTRKNAEIYSHLVELRDFVSSEVGFDVKLTVQYGDSWGIYWVGDLAMVCFKKILASDLNMNLEDFKTKYLTNVCKRREFKLVGIEKVEEEVITHFIVNNEPFKVIDGTYSIRVLNSNDQNLAYLDNAPDMLQHQLIRLATEKTTCERICEDLTIQDTIPLIEAPSSYSKAQLSVLIP